MPDGLELGAGLGCIRTSVAGCPFLLRVDILERLVDGLDCFSDANFAAWYVVYTVCYDKPKAVVDRVQEKGQEPLLRLGYPLVDV